VWACLRGELLAWLRLVLAFVAVLLGLVPRSCDFSGRLGSTLAVTASKLTRIGRMGSTSFEMEQSGELAIAMASGGVELVALERAQAYLCPDGRSSPATPRTCTHTRSRLLARAAAPTSIYAESHISVRLQAARCRIVAAFQRAPGTRWEELQALVQQRRASAIPHATMRSAMHGLLAILAAP